MQRGVDEHWRWLLQEEKRTSRNSLITPRPIGTKKPGHPHGPCADEPVYRLTFDAQEGSNIHLFNTRLLWRFVGGAVSGYRQSLASGEHPRQSRLTHDLSTLALPCSCLENWWQRYALTTLMPSSVGCQAESKPLESQWWWSCCGTGLTRSGRLKNRAGCCSDVSHCSASEHL